MTKIASACVHVLAAGKGVAFDIGDFSVFNAVPVEMTAADCGRQRV